MNYLYKKQNGFEALLGEISKGSSQHFETGNKRDVALNSRFSFLAFTFPL